MTTPLAITSNQTQHDPALPLLVDVAKAATILATSRSSVYQLIWNKQLTPVRIGRSVRFSIAQLEQFVADRFSEGGAPDDHSRT
jgi:excisionase family DNA binding protein